MSAISFKPGQVWTTRGGGKVRIYATDGAGAFPIHGALWHDNRGGYFHQQSWTADGHVYGNRGESAIDLVRPYDWRAELAPIWAVLRPEYEWVAMDRDGRWWAYQGEPTYELTNGIWKGWRATLMTLRFPTPDCDWTETATQRPSAEVGP